MTKLTLGLLEHEILYAISKLSTYAKRNRAMTGNPDAHNPLLHAIADALGVPVEMFFNAPQRAASEDVIALLEAWTAIGNPQGQRRVLSFAQHEAERAGGGGSSEA